MVQVAGLATRLTTTGDLSTMLATAQLTVYRIVQESLTNVLKHACNVNQVTVDIARQSAGVTVTVSNCGDVTHDPHRVGGHGPAGMQERADVYGGRVDARAHPRGGWTTRATLPLIQPAFSR